MDSVIQERDRLRYECAISKVLIKSMEKASSTLKEQRLKATISHVRDQNGLLATQVEETEKSAKLLQVSSILNVFPCLIGVFV